MVTNIDRSGLLDLVDAEEMQIVDVLPEAEYFDGHLPGLTFVQTIIDDLPGRLKGLVNFESDRQSSLATIERFVTELSVLDIPTRQIHAERPIILEVRGH